MRPRTLAFLSCVVAGGAPLACGTPSAVTHGPAYGSDAATPATDAKPDANVDSGGAVARPFPDALGAHYDPEGVAIRFRVFSRSATRIELHLFSKASGEDARAHVAMAQDHATGVWSAVVTDLASKGIAGDVYYGYRAWGPNWEYDASWVPGSLKGFHADVDGAGNRMNPNKLLFDPYARELSHDPLTPDSLDGNVFQSGETSRAADSAHAAPKAIVLHDEAPPSGTRPSRAFKDDIVYEVQLRGFTMNDPTVPAAARGTYKGAALKAAYLRDLGVTAIELQPVHETQNDTNDLASAKMTTSGMNYWGYSTLAYFAPDRRYSTDKSPGGPTREWKSMVEAMHAVGIKVMLDVVYNHTGEGGISKTNPAVARLLSFRGLDNPSYYELSTDKQTAFDSTGTSGNFNTAVTVTRDIIVDSLRYWKDTMGVDGFRFDLGPVLGNACDAACFTYDKLDPRNALNRAVAELPARPLGGGQGVDLVAEPWAIGPGTYQLGNFPAGWSEWNGSFRDTVRSAQNELNTTPMPPAKLVARLAGSPDMFAKAGRKPSSAVNYIASHDGFTLRDVYAYTTKVNTQPWPFGPSGGGDDDNKSWNQGGDATLQRRAARTGVALAALSAGVPMITGGDEMYRTQYGNNNAYNLDSDKNWLDWSNLTGESAFFAFTQGVFRFRSAHAALRPAEFLEGRDHDANGLKDITWLGSAGAEVDAVYLNDAAQHFVAFRLDGTEGGDSVASIYVAYNAWSAGVKATLPTTTKAWFVAGDSATGVFSPTGQETALTGGTYAVDARSVAVLVER